MIDVLKFQGGQSTQLFADEIYPLKIGDYVFPTECIIGVRGTKNIVRTEIPGGNGTVKELVSFPDYEITIAGSLSYKNNTELLMEFENMVALWNNSESLPIVCKYTEAFGITNIALVGFTPMMREGFESVIWYTIEAVSDNEIDLKVGIKQNLRSTLRKFIGI